VRASAPLTDRWAVALAASAAAGAWWSAPPPVWVLVGAPAAAMLCRRPAVVCLACLVVVAGLGARAEAGLRVPSGSWQGSVTLVTDPVTQFGSVRAEVRAGGTHLLVVSGENVALLLAVAAPLLRRCRLGPRLAVTLPGR
jgi:hypothetical protein